MAVNPKNMPEHSSNHSKRKQHTIHAGGKLGISLFCVHSVQTAFLNLSAKKRTVRCNFLNNQ